ncbi:MAG: hypothetical protein WAS21_15560 [Geminicoccaceae bacterium]
MHKWAYRRLGLSTRTFILAVGTVLAACQTTPAAAAVTTHFAVVREDGLVTRSSETVVVERTDKGTYAVAFTTVPDVSRCAFVATIGTGNGHTPGIGFITVMEHPFQQLEPRFKRYLFVNTHNASRAPDDRPFHLILTCN